jgi:hypothetical protein
MTALEIIALVFLLIVAAFVLLVVYSALVISGEGDDFVFPDRDERDEEWQ